MRRTRGGVVRAVALVLGLAVMTGGLGSCALLRSSMHVWFPPDVFVPAPSDGESALVVVPIYFRNTFQPLRYTTGVRMVQSGYSFRAVETTEEIGGEYRTGWQLEVRSDSGAGGGTIGGGWRSRAVVIRPQDGTWIRIMVSHGAPLQFSPAAAGAVRPGSLAQVAFDRPAGGTLAVYPNVISIVVEGSGFPNVKITERPLTAREAERIERDLARNPGYDLWERAELTGVAADYPASRP